MKYYLIKYTGNLWSEQKVFTQAASAEEYKSILDKRNTSNCKYMVVVCPGVNGSKDLRKLVEYQLSKLNQLKAA